MVKFDTGISIYEVTYPIVVVLEVKQEGPFRSPTHLAAYVDQSQWGDTIDLPTFRRVIREAKLLAQHSGFRTKLAAIMRSDKLLAWAAKRDAYISF